MANLTCVMCDGSNAKLCSSCHSISYCSPKCQKEDWSIHKMICKKFTTLPTRPSPSHKIGILFPVDSKSPQLVWIECEPQIDEDGIAWDLPKTDNLLGVENLDTKYSAREFKKITRNKLRKFNLKYTVEVIIREAGLIDGSSPNVCVQHTTRGKMTHDWRGPIVVMHQPGTSSDPLVYEDILAGDLRIAIDYFVSY